MGHLLGYARVSTTDQQPQLQVDALQRAGCYRVLTETASGARTDRPVLEQLLCVGGPPPTVEVAAAAPTVCLWPELTLKLTKTPDPHAVGADVRLDDGSHLADGC